VLALAGCVTGNVHYDASKPHHTPQGFTNNYPPNPAYRRPELGFFESWLARIRNWTSDVSVRAPIRQLHTMAPDLALVHDASAGIRLTWIGHASFLLQTESGINVLTDPIFEDRASPLPFAGPKRHQPPGLTIDQLPHVHMVLLSHSHYDHLSLASLRALYRQAGGPPTFFTPLGVDRWLMRNITAGDAKHVVAMDWWDKASYKGLDVFLLPVHHWSSRTPWDRNETLWGAFALRQPGFSFFFSGDLGYSRDITDIAAKFDGFDLAAIGIGAYEPLWYRNSHLSPEEAVRVHKELRIKRSIGMHWGTFALGQERLDQAVDDLAIARRQEGLADDEFMVMQHGQTLRLRP
jgi:L-ascorbate metabolism protein UlaG (beta-lactamase superfamily)